MSPAQMFAMKVVRFMHDHGVEQSALRAISLACYEHAQANPRAVMHGRPLDEQKKLAISAPAERGQYTSLDSMRPKVGA